MRKPSYTRTVRGIRVGMNQRHTQRKAVTVVVTPYIIHVKEYSVKNEDVSNLDRLSATPAPVAEDNDRSWTGPQPEWPETGCRMSDVGGGGNGGTGGGHEGGLSQDEKGGGAPAPNRPTAAAAAFAWAMMSKL